MGLFSNPWKTLQKFRQQTFNVVYFLSRGKTRSFQINTLTIFWIMSVGVLSFGWLFVSSSLMAYIFVQNQDLKSKLQVSRGQTFAYQLQYEDVLERSYKDVEESNLIAEEKPNPLLSVSVLDDGIVDSMAQAEQLSEDLLSEPMDSLFSETQSDSDSDTDALGGSDTVDIDALDFVGGEIDHFQVEVNASLKEDTNGSFQVSYNLRNQDPPAIKKGYVGFVASVLNKDGERSVLTYPQNVETTADQITPRNPKNGLWFRIKNYKEDKFKLDNIDFTGLEIQAAKLFLADVDGKIVKFIELNPLSH